MEKIEQMTTEETLEEIRSRDIERKEVHRKYGDASKAYYLLSSLPNPPAKRLLKAEEQMKFYGRQLAALGLPMNSIPKKRTNRQKYGKDAYC